MFFINELYYVGEDIMMKMSNFRWKVAWLIFIVSFVSYMDRVNLSVATPVIMKEYVKKMLPDYIERGLEWLMK